MSESVGAAAGEPLFAGENGEDLLGLLERRVEALVGRHREALALVEDLRSQLAERDREIERLGEEAAETRRVRDEVLRRIDGLLARIGDLERGAAPAEPGADA